MAFLLPWSVLFVARTRMRRRMIWVSVLTMLLGLTEPLFVPAYWNPLSLFYLAQRMGFNIESLIAAFAIGGLATADYDLLTLGPVDQLNKAPIAGIAPRSRVP